MAKKTVRVDEPDPILEALSRGAEWVMANRFLVAGVLVMVLVVAGAVTGWVYHRNKLEERGALAFSRAMRMYKGLSPQAKKEEMEGVVGAFEKVVKDYPDSKWAHFAHLYMGNCYRRMGNKDKAVKEYELGVEGIKSEKYLYPQWLTALAITQGPDKGISTLEKGLKGEKPFLEPYLLYNLALLYQEKGDLEKTAKILEELNGKYPSSPFGLEARRLLEVLK